MNCDLVITNGTVVTMVHNQATIPDGAVAVRGGEIVAVAPASELLDKTPTVKILDANGGLILPGFINTHGHLAMTLLRGMADDLPLQVWLEKHIWPAERTLMDADTVALGTRLAVAESIRAGVTCVTDMYFHADRVTEVLKEMGMRGVVSEGLLDFPTPSYGNPEEGLERQRKLLLQYCHDPLVVPAVAAHATYTVSAANLVKEAELSDEYGAPFLIHLSETRWEVDKINTEKNTSPVKYLADLGVLSERTVAAHCVHVTTQDLDLLAEFEVGVSINLASNLKLASGIPPLPQMLDRGIKIGLGTDGAASNNTLDLLRDAQLAALLYKGLTGDPTCLPARRVVELLTIDGARTLGIADRVGSIAVGKRADIICMGLTKTHATPLFDPYSHIAYAARSADVEHVVIDGRVVMQDNQLLNCNLDDVLNSVRSLRHRFNSYTHHPQS